MTNNFDLKSLEIKSFRGIKHFDLSFLDNNNKNTSLVLCGANGSGKSSFANAFEYLFTGEVKSLKGTHDINHNKVIVHKGDENKDLLIKATIGNYEISRKFKKELEYPEELADLVDDFKSDKFILNRKKLLEFIESQPKNRYDKISGLIGFTKYDNIEKSLSKCEYNLNNELKYKKQEKTNKIDEITSIYDCEFDDVIDRTNEILTKNNFNPISLEDDFEMLIQSLPHHDNYLDEIDENHIISLNELYLDQLKTYENISLESLKSSDLLLSILTNSKKYLIDEESDKCPVCQNSIDNEELINYIDIKKEELENETNSLKNWKNKNEKLINEIENLNYKLKDYDLGNFINDLKELSKFDKKISQMDKDVLTNLNEYIISLKEKNDTKLEELSIAREVIRKLAENQKIENDIKKLEKQHEIAEKTYELFLNNKKETLEHILSEIIEYIRKYYKFIHKGDANHTPGMKVKEKKIELDIIFDSEEHNPREYSSEGHIDSLGLCIFLAFAKVSNKNKFIILDDIIATVDMDHKERIARLLFEEFEDYTLLITTHSKLWFEQLKRISDTYSKKVSFIEIIDWDEKLGPTLSKSIPQEERIEEYIKQNDSFAAGNGIRRYFEFILDNVVKVNAINLPLKQHYTLDEYYKPTKSYFKDIFEGSEFQEYYEQIFNEIDKTVYMGNLMSHNNESNYDLTINEIKLFKDAVYAFKKSMTCYNHKNKYLKFDKEKHLAICSQEKCNYIFTFTEIKRLINTNDSESAQKALINYFESILKRIIKLNEIELHSKKEYSTLDYYVAVKHYLKDYFKNSSIEKYYNNVFKKIDNTKFMQDLMSEKIDENNILNNKQLIQFKQAVDEFKKSMTCKEHEGNYLEFKNDIINCDFKDCELTIDLTKK